MKTVEPFGSPNWEAWLYTGEVDRLDAVCLSMNICPQEAREGYGILDAMRGDEDEGLGGPRVSDINAATTFQRRLFTTRHYGKRVKLVEFANFAYQLGWEMPAQLASLVTVPRPAHAIPTADALGSTTEREAKDKRADGGASKPSESHRFCSIEKETRTHVETECAAFWLNRKPQTLRAWASKENGPLRPSRLHRRLIWSVADIKRVLGKR